MNKTDGLLKVTEEIIGLEELQKYLESGQTLNHYIGFEISGLVHLGSGLMTGLVVRELQKLGVNTSFWLADWHTWINNKLQGDMGLIGEVAKGYFEPALKISAQIAGANQETITSRYGTEIYHNNDRFWQTVVEVSKNLTLSRIVKSTTILGRQESDSNPFAFMLYPIMQTADIFELNVNIAHAGTDQRKVHVIAREVAPKLKIKPLLNDKSEVIKPIAIHHHLLLGLQKPATWPLPDGAQKETIRTEMKMSKSIKGSAIFIHDTPDEIKEKIKNAFCPEKETEINPVLDWVEHMILPIVGKIDIKRDPKFGGNFTVTDYDDLKQKFATGELHPVDLKNNITEILIDILEPARKHFASQESQNLIAKIKEKQSR